MLDLLFHLIFLLASSLSLGTEKVPSSPETLKPFFSPWVRLEKREDDGSFSSPIERVISIDSYPALFESLKGMKEAETKIVTLSLDPESSPETWKITLLHLDASLPSHQASERMDKGNCLLREADFPLQWPFLPSGEGKVR